MCIAILRPAGATIPIERLDDCALANHDGAGYAFVLNGKVKIVKNREWSRIRKQFKHDTTVYGASSPFLIHFRIATHGEVSNENCHPWAMADGGAMVHNGVFHIPGQPDGCSDSGYFVDKFLNSLPSGWQYDGFWCEVVERVAQTGNKAAMLWPSGAVWIMNARGGDWRKEDDGVLPSYNKSWDELVASGASWYSNHSYAKTLFTPHPFVPSPINGQPKTTVGEGLKLLKSGSDLPGAQACGCHFDAQRGLVTCIEHSNPVYAKDNAWINFYWGFSDKAPEEQTQAEREYHQKSAIARVVIKKKDTGDYCPQCGYVTDSESLRKGHRCTQVSWTCPDCSVKEVSFASYLDGDEEAEIEDAISEELKNVKWYHGCKASTATATWTCPNCKAKLQKTASGYTRKHRLAAVAELKSGHKCRHGAILSVDYLCPKCHHRDVEDVEFTSQTDIWAKRAALRKDHECVVISNVEKMAAEIADAVDVNKIYMARHGRRM